MEILGVPVLKRARAGIIAAIIYVTVTLFVPYFIGSMYGEIYFLFFPLFPVMTISVAMALVLQDYDRFWLSKKMPVIPIGITALLMALCMEEPEYEEYILLCGGLYAMTFLALLQSAYKISFDKKDYWQAFAGGTLFLLPAAAFYIPYVKIPLLIFGVGFLQVLTGIITERAFQRRYPGRN